MRNIHWISLLSCWLNPLNYFTHIFGQLDERLTLTLNIPTYFAPSTYQVGYSTTPKHSFFAVISLIIIVFEWNKNQNIPKFCTGRKCVKCDLKINRVKIIKPVESGWKWVKTAVISAKLLSFHQKLSDQDEIKSKTSQKLFWIKLGKKKNGWKKNGWK